MTDDEIRAIFLDNGFTIKDGCDDLKPYVYRAARALLEQASPEWCRCSGAGTCLGCLIEQTVAREFGSAGLEYLVDRVRF